MKFIKIYLTILTQLLLLLNLIANNNGYYNVYDFGAKGNGLSVDTEAIQEAINTCFQKGGGIVILPSGTFLTGTLYLRSQVHLELSLGATLLASRNQSDYPVRALIFGENLENIVIGGQGTINGQAEYRWDVDTGNNLYADGVPSDFHPTFKRPFPVSPNPKIIQLVNCNNVTVQDITILKSPSWTIHPWGCKNVHIDGVTIENELEIGAWTDGIDPDGCQDVWITNCRVTAGDDAIAIKTTDNFGTPKPCENIVISNCILTSASSGIKIGTETKADIRDVTVSNCIIKGSNRGLGIIVRDTAHVSNIHYSDITIDCKRHNYFWWGNGDPFFFVVWKRPKATKHGSISNVSVNNVRANICGTGLIEGVSGQLKNISFQNVILNILPEYVSNYESGSGPYLSEHYYYDKIFPKGDDKYFLGKSALRFLNVKELHLDNIRIYFPENISSKWKNAIQCEDITDLGITELSIKQAKSNDSPLLLFKNVQNALIRNSVAEDHTNLFLKIQGEMTENIRLQYNDLSKVKNPVVIEPESLIKMVKIVD
jgi:hypothetical protein